MIEFTKVHGNGNDFIVLENLNSGNFESGNLSLERRYSSSDLSRFARLLCRRKFSVGADGILVIEKPEKPETADFAMRIFNSDGSEGEMCGNGARALARYAFEKKWAGASMRFTTLAGSMQARVDPPYVELDMGELSLEGGVFGRTLEFRGREFPYVFLTAGVPHCVLLVKDYDAIGESSKIEIGRGLSRDFARFPKGSNVSFAQLISQNEAKAVTYERGVENLTESCGTGSVAVAVAFAIVENAARVLRVRNPGGVNEVRLNFAPGDKTCHAWLKGRTALVAEGQIREDALYEEDFLYGEGSMKKDSLIQESSLNKESSLSREGPLNRESSLNRKDLS
ncbi:MAG: diaminopimelate epimerase [Synergistaceae bacterium]|nr:diaminopimelate epimerase [Synergistaceae bacterium]